jgi:hypothetical protein
MQGVTAMPKLDQAVADKKIEMMGTVFVEGRKSWVLRGVSYAPKIVSQKGEKANQSVCGKQRKKRQEEERNYIEKLNDLTRPMPKSFWNKTKRR